MNAVLVVDDSEDVQGAVELVLETRARYLKATTLEEASFQFVLHWDEIDFILVDGSVPPGNLEGAAAYEPWDWVYRVRSLGYEGDIIAFSANPSSQKKLMEAGCNDEFAKGEERLERLLELLTLSTPQ